MSALDDYSDEELGRLVRKAAEGREQEAQEAVRSRTGLAKFLEDVGLLSLAQLVKDGVVYVFQRIGDILSFLFG